MAFTYNDNMQSLLHKVRFLIGDTVSVDEGTSNFSHLLQDTEIESLLSVHNDDEVIAAAWALRGMSVDQDILVNLWRRNGGVDSVVQIGQNLRAASDSLLNR